MVFKKRVISVILTAFMLSAAAVPAYAAMPDGSIDKIAVPLSEGQVSNFRLPDLPSSFTDTYQWINGITVTTTQNNYVPSMWFKIYVPAENQEIEWTLSSVSSSTFTDYISVVIAHESDINTSRCYGYWQVAKNATKTEQITKAGYAYIHLYGKDVTTELSFIYSLRDYVPAVDEPENTVIVEPEVPAKDESTPLPIDATQDSEITDEPITIPDVEPQINLDSASTWARDAISDAVSAGYVPTEIQDNYTSVITRSEFCRMAVKWVEHATGKGIDTVLAEKGVSRNPNAFTDTNDADILAAYALGITNGTGANTFTPNGSFTREQAATMIMNTCKAIGANINNPADSGFADLKTASSWAVNGINFVSANGIMQGTGSNIFSPKATYTREQSILTFNNIEPGNLRSASPTLVPTQSAAGEPKIENINKYMTVKIDAAAQLAFCVYQGGDFNTTSTWIRNGEEVFVYGVTTETYDGLIMAKINYNGQDGWVANMWLK